MPFTALWRNFMADAAAYQAFYFNRAPGVWPTVSETAARATMLAAWNALAVIEKEYYVLAGGPNLTLRYASTTGFGKAQP